MCIDYRGLNNVTIKNRYPLHLMDTLREQVSKAKVFSKLDLRDGYYLIRIKEENKWKTTFRTRYRHFEYKVIPFRLCNTPATFQNMIHEVLRVFLDQGVVVYLDDILVYSETEEEYVKLLTKVFMCLAKYNLAVAVHKSVFHVPEVEFLGYIVNGTGISVSGETTQVIRDWEVPKNLRGVRAFIGFANFYRRFIRNFSSIVRPITDLTKRDVKWYWGPEQQNAFDTLLTAFSTPPILRHYDPRTNVIIETDASNFAIGCVLSQDWKNKLHPVAFHSRKMSSEERNYEIHDKELLAIVEAFKVWSHYCQGPSSVTVLTDHHNLKYFRTSTKLNQRQARWAEKLSQYGFTIKHRPGMKSGKPDALSRRREYAEGEEGAEIITDPLLKHELLISAVTAIHPFLIRRLNSNAKLPIRGTDLSAGVDIMANEELIIPLKQQRPVQTGIAISIPGNTYASIAPRSGL